MSIIYCKVEEKSIDLDINESNHDDCESLDVCQHTQDDCECCGDCEIGRKAD